MPKRNKDSDLKTNGISIMSHNVKMQITLEDLRKNDRIEIGKKINIKLDDNGEFINGRSEEV